VDDAGLQAKQAAVAAGLGANADLIASGPLAALAAVGGLELAAMTGAILAAAERNMPTLVDGFVCGAAALAAVRHKPEVARCLFVSHQSAEAGAQRLLQELGCGSAVLQLGMRLGEGTGALLALPLLRSAAAILTDMAALKDVLAATV
jgi:nicotinate-nucleotide--dimethylbenzimidazole phosphoribosyltransferase